jgi:hypothetical protein
MSQLRLNAVPHCLPAVAAGTSAFSYGVSRWAHLDPRERR